MYYFIFSPIYYNHYYVVMICSDTARIIEYFLAIYL